MNAQFSANPQQHCQAITCIFCYLTSTIHSLYLNNNAKSLLLKEYGDAKQYKWYHQSIIKHGHIVITKWYSNSLVQLEAKLYGYLHNWIQLCSNWFDSKWHHLASMFIWKFVFPTHTSNTTLLRQPKHHTLGSQPQIPSPLKAYWYCVSFHLRASTTWKHQHLIHPYHRSTVQPLHNGPPLDRFSLLRKSIDLLPSPTAIPVD